MEIFLVISLLAELLVIALAAALALNKKKTYGWLFAASFALFLVYDIMGYLNVSVDGNIGGLMLLAGALLSIVAMWQLYTEKKK